MTQPTIEQVQAYARQIASNATLANPDAKALHWYRNEQGEPLYWRVRLKNTTTTGEKWIRPFWWNGEAFQMGEPTAASEGKPLYGLERLGVNPEAVVIVTEGENCTDAIHKLNAPGIIAVTSGSTGTAQAANWQPLAGRTVMVWPDNDEPGAKYAADVVGKLQGIAASVAVLDIAPLNLPPKGDAVDWIKVGGTAEALIEMVAGAMVVQDAAQTAQEAPQGDEEVQATPSPAAEPESPESQESETEILARLAALSPLEYDRQRGRYSELLGVRASALDAQVKAMRKEVVSDEGISFGDVEPWHERIMPDELLSELSATVRRFIVCQQETADAVALWAAMTWFIDVVQVAPIAVITAPEKRCGKSQLLFLLGKLSQRPLVASNISPAAVFRTIDAWKPTLLIDEADAFMRENEELRGLLNCGHTRDSAYTVRIVGEAMTPTRFNVWGAKAIAGIGHLADTLMDRAVTLELRRKLEHEKVERQRYAEPDLFETLAAKLARFAEDYREAVRRARPALPPSLNDRAQDNWEPLLAIAEVAGGEWPATAKRAALKLSGADSTTESVGSELLADIREVFEMKRLTRISSVNLIAALCEDEEKGWATYNRVKPLSPRQLNRKLDGYGINSKKIRVGHETPNGFEIAQFTDAFARYLSPPGKMDLNPEHSPKPNNNAGSGVPDKTERSALLSENRTRNALILGECSAVPDVMGDSSCVPDSREVEL